MYQYHRYIKRNGYGPGRRSRTTKSRSLGCIAQRGDYWSLPVRNARAIWRTASRRSNGRRPSALVWAEPAPASTTKSDSPARMAMHACARPASGSGDEVPQRNTLRPSYSPIVTAFFVTAFTAVSSNQSCPALEFQIAAPTAMIEKPKPTTSRKILLDILMVLVSVAARCLFRF